MDKQMALSEKKSSILWSLTAIQN